MSENVVAMGKSEQEIAQDILTRTRVAIGTVLKIMDEARAEGMVVQFQLGQDGFGRNVIAGISVVKVVA